MESDWIKFRALVPALRERYLAERNQRIRHLLDAPAKTEAERFWDVADLVKKESTILGKCLDGHSRSNMWLYLVAMRSAGMLADNDLEGFSDELRAQVFGGWYEKSG